MSEIDFDAPEASYAMAKLVPKRTGLPMVVRIAPNEGYPHDCRVKVARQHGARGRWADSASITVRPDQRLIGQLDAEDFRIAAEWIRLNRAVILEYWDGVLDDIGDVLPRLQRRP
ncbi:MAG TPA: hypothetical protein VJ770_15515 [Stellaceae bacterium]|nr:hypothetical protein [Stellaceae bacterium]